MKTIIIEDEQPAVERLRLLLSQCDSRIEVVHTMDSIEESVNWLKKEPAPDFILLDIHLSDGSAFEIFKQIKISTPVIFTTAYDKYAIDAFKVLSIDYLLKPVTIESLKRAIDKLLQLKKTSAPDINYTELIQWMQSQSHRYKNRFLGKVGQKIFFIDANDVSFFSAENKIIYLFSTDGTRYIVDYTLETLEEILDPACFFRANRSTILQAKAITQVKPFLNSRLKVLSKFGNRHEELVISRERVAAFKKWAES